MKDPYLIQRCRTKKVEFNPSMRTSEYFDLDYMGSSEFEYGAIPAFQRRFFAKLTSGKQFRILSVPVSPVYTLYAAVDEQFADVYAYVLFKLYHKEIRTKEPTYIRESLHDGPQFCNIFCFWMDLTNDVIITMHQDLIYRFFTTVKNSVAYMDEIKDK